MSDGVGGRELHITCLIGRGWEEEHWLWGELPVGKITYGENYLWGKLPVLYLYPLVHLDVTLQLDGSYCYTVFCIIQYLRHRGETS